MNFIWIQDFDIVTSQGGAQLTDRSHFLEGVRRGHQMELLTPATGVSPVFTDAKKGATVIASNPVFLNVDVFNKFIEKDIPFIYFFHDYHPLCKYRLFYPMSGQCRHECYLKERWLPILLHAKMLVWLSPLHRQAWLWACPELEHLPYAIIPSPVDPTQFYPMGLDREGVIAVQSLHEFKGRELVLKWVEEHPEVRVTMVGGNPFPQIPLPANCTYHEWVPQEQLNELYNRHKALLHLPMNPMPYDRTAAEAYLAGCDIIGNDLIGALSFDWWHDRDTVRKHSISSSTDFWMAVESACPESSN